MKKFLSIMLVAVLIVTSMATVAFADGGSATASVSKSQTVKAGDTVTLTVTVSGKFSNYELTMKAAEGLTITSITGVTSNINNGKVAFSSATNNETHSFQVTVKVSDTIEPGSYKVTADLTKASMIVPIEEDTEDGIPDTLVRVSLADGSATLTVDCKHDWSDWTQTKAPTCDEKGEETRTCSICGEVETRAIDAKGHQWGAWTQTKAPTCTVKGEETRTCSVCGETETRPVDKAPHTWGEWVVTKAATCTDDGLKTRTCSVCGEKQTEVIPAAEGHKWGEWTVIKAATCTEDGEQTRKCSVCGEVETEIIPAAGHDWDEEIWCYDETHHWHVCSVCGEKCEHIAEHGPITEWQIVKEPTAKEAGLQQKFCEVCGAVVASEEIPATGEGPIDPVPGTGDPTNLLMIGGAAFLLLLLLLLVALYMIKRKAAK